MSLNCRAKSIYCYEPLTYINENYQNVCLKITVPSNKTIKIKRPKRRITRNSNLLYKSVIENDNQTDNVKKKMQ